MPEKLARSVVVTPCCRHHSLTERPLPRHSWICAAHSCSSARCFNSALVILTSHNTTVAKPFATFLYYCLMCVYARLGLTVTAIPLFILGTRTIFIYRGPENRFSGPLDNTFIFCFLRCNKLNAQYLYLLKQNNQLS